MRRCLCRIRLIIYDPETGRPIYRYPLIQFKIVDNTPCIIALTDRAVEIFSDIFMSMDEISIEGQVIPVNEKDLKIETVEFGYTQETFMFHFSSPWIALNQNNFQAIRSTKISGRERQFAQMKS